MQPRIDLRRRQKRPALQKLVNRKRGLEFRPILKASSTFLNSFLPCLQPGEWEPVHVMQRMASNHTAFVVIREPVKRFASALSEVARRVFAGQCPGGPCSNAPAGAPHADFYYTSGPKDTADALARTTSWYQHALRIYLHTLDSIDGQGRARQPMSSASREGRKAAGKAAAKVAEEVAMLREQWQEHKLRLQAAAREERSDRAARRSSLTSYATHAAHAAADEAARFIEAAAEAALADLGAAAIGALLSAARRLQQQHWLATAPGTAAAADTEGDAPLRFLGEMSALYDSLSRQIRREVRIVCGMYRAALADVLSAASAAATAAAAAAATAAAAAAGGGGSGAADAECRRGAAAAAGGAAGARARDGSR